MNCNRIPPWVDKEDIQQVVELARLEAARFGFDPDLAAEAARRDFLWAERERGYRFVPISIAAGPDAGAVDTEEWVCRTRKVVSISPPRKQTEGQRRQFLRNQLIFIGSISGFSQRQLATVFDTSKSRIAAIIEQMREKTGHRCIDSEST